MTATAAPGDPPIRIEGLAIRYPGRREPAIEGVSLDVAAGERVGVAGRTGAGKSTLALAAAGFIPRVVRAKVDGSILVEDQDAATAPGGALLGRVGIVFATPANQLSASKLTVREELAFGLENLGVPRDQMDERIDATLERLAIGHLADREPFALSGGEQQRVAIASIVAMGTSVLVLDEPTAQLDPAGTSSVADLLDELARAGTAILCVEHDPSVIGRMDRLLVLDAGRPLALDLPGAALATAEDAGGPQAPTLVRLAGAARVAQADAFDEATIAAALVGSGVATRGAAVPAEPSLAVPVAPSVPPSTGWAPASGRVPVSVAFEDLVHRYPSGIEAVRGVSLTIEPGEAVAILGQNGSGKTTLVKHLNGLLRPASGRVLIDGHPVDERSIADLAATVGFVFQNPDEQLFERSVEREVAFGPRNLKVAPAEIVARVKASLLAVGLADQRTTNPYDLDLSRRKLVALAGILAMDPAVLVLDEPTTGQDAEGLSRVGAVVEAMRSAGRSVIAITHDMEFAATRFGRIVVMRDGVVVADGPPATVFAPGNADLLSSTGLTPPPAARIAARMGLGIVPLDAAELLAALGR
ncbi:MAG TPA: ABC transporter ATP-binding protein [Candidatus Limnocylindrales bacterium]